MLVSAHDQAREYENFTMRSEGTRAQKATTVIPLSSSSRILPLVGRLREVMLVMDVYDVAMDGSARVVLMTGEPGIGKMILSRFVGV